MVANFFFIPPSLPAREVNWGEGSRVTVDLYFMDPGGRRGEGARIRNSYIIYVLIVYLDVFTIKKENIQLSTYFDFSLLPQFPFFHP